MSTTTISRTTTQPSQTYLNPKHGDAEPVEQPTAEDVATKAQKDFFWSYTEEPHRTRRHAIIKAHPEVTKICGTEPLTKWIVLGVVSLQILCAYLVRDAPFFSATFLLTSYIIGATANQNLFLAIHEISHNLAFKSPSYNRALAIFANLPIGIPYSASFRPYHLTHHKSLGVDGLDVDLPTPFEAVFLHSVAGKAFFCTFQILFYALRPMFVYQLPITKVHAANIAVQLLVDAFLVKTMGWRSLGYLVFSSFLAGSLHPCAGHFIAEHYILSSLRTVVPSSTATSDTANDLNRTLSAEASNAASLAPAPEETYSYYGPLNLLTYNVGYHNEHHDFPAVPWTRLPKLREIAKEFYDELPCHESWTLVLWHFIRDDDCGLWSRVKRKEGGRKVGPGMMNLKADDQGE